MKTRPSSIKVLICIFLCIQVLPMLNLRAQDYQITFAGSGGSTTVDSVFVENLTLGTTLKMKGSDILHLKGTVSVFETSSEKEMGKITFYPNPMKDFGKMQFILPEAGETMITLYDIAGKEIVKTRDLLSRGEHTYSIRDLREGIYLANITVGRYSLSGKLISSGSAGNSVKIVHESSAISKDEKTDSKGTNDEAVMQYNTGDRLKLMGKSGIYRTVVTDVPAASKTITYNFIACTDGDGNNYPIVQIGSAKGIIDNPDQSTDDKGVQTWMTENLKATKYNDGTDIPLVTDGAIWTSLLSPAYCWYNNLPANRNIYGALYNWFTVNTGKLCPASWHIPTDAEWTVLEDYLGGRNGAALKLKETGTRYWASPNTGATNETGFTARPGGYRSNVYDGIGYWGRWWSSTEQTAPGKGIDNAALWPDSSDSKSIYVWVRAMDNQFANTWRGVNEKYWGLSVRCVKD